MGISLLYRRGLCISLAGEARCRWTHGVPRLAAGQRISLSWCSERAGYLRGRRGQLQREPLGMSEAHDCSVSRLLGTARDLWCRPDWRELSPALSSSFCRCKLLSCQRLFIRAPEFIPTACSEPCACVVVAPAVDGLLLRMWGVSIAVDIYIRM